MFIIVEIKGDSRKEPKKVICLNTSVIESIESNKRSNTRINLIDGRTFYTEESCTEIIQKIMEGR